MIDDRIKLLAHRLATERWVPAQAQRWIVDCFEAISDHLTVQRDAAQHDYQTILERDQYQRELLYRVNVLAHRSLTCPTCHEIAMMTQEIIMGGYV